MSEQEKTSSEIKGTLFWLQSVMVFLVVLKKIPNQIHFKILAKFASKGSIKETQFKEVDPMTHKTWPILFGS